ncbi:MAG: hypothetical protein KC619_12770 [Myxococcales bacterium]|nr:hypothetical protein [Myxococcales bacterium]
MTERDQFIQAQVQGMLQPGETIRNMAFVQRTPSIFVMMLCYWAYFFMTKSYYAALTDRRIILIQTSMGLFRPKIANNGTDQIDLSTVQSVSLGGFLNNRTIDFKKKDGSTEFLRIAPWFKLCSGQGKFMDDVKATAGALTAG